MMADHVNVGDKVLDTATLIPNIIKPAAIELKKPIVTALGAKVKVIGQSTEGVDPGISLSLIPLNAGISSLKNVLTPINITSTPAANVNACRIP
jgi:hypothetical protein